MALITDPDDVLYEINTYTGTKEIFVDLPNKVIRLTRVGALSTDGITLKAIYSKMKDIWLASSEAIKYAFPMTPITDESFELLDNWNFYQTGSGNDYTPNLIRTGGWTRYNTSGLVIEKWAGIITLGSIQSGGQVYYLQSASGSAVNVNLTGAVNQTVQIFRDDDGDGNTSEGSDYDRTAYFKIFIRTQGNLYATSQLSDIGVTIMSNQVYRFPLADSDDSKISVADTDIDANTDGTADVSPYTGMSIEWFATAEARTVNGVSRDFHVIIDGNSGTLQQIYEFVQWSLRQTVDIDAGAGTKTGKLTNELVYFVGSDLYTRLDSTGGVYIDNTLAGDNNLLHYMSDNGTQYTNARAATLTLQIGENLTDDASSIYRVFFTNDDAGDNLGYDYGTANAITMYQMGGTTDMAGSISSQSTIELLYDYDNNDQRGTGSEGTDVPFTAVGIGLSTGQFVKGTGTISGTTLSGSTGLSAALERNYTA